jgi:hypothetical protein
MPRKRWTGFANHDGSGLNMTSVQVSAIAGLEPTYRYCGRPYDLPRGRDIDPRNPDGFSTQSIVPSFIHMIRIPVLTYSSRDPNHNSQNSPRSENRQSRQAGRQAANRGSMIYHWRLLRSSRTCIYIHIGGHRPRRHHHHAENVASQSSHHTQQTIT